MFEKWFANKCLAIVGDDGLALSGLALENAQKNHLTKRCDYLVNRRAKFCSRCGSLTPGGWWRCGSCNQWIGNESQRCPRCGKQQNVSARLDLADGVWQKGDDVFAQRFESLDVQTLMQKGLSIQEGQCAILLEGGAFADVLPPGHYPPEEIVGLQEYLQSNRQKSFVIVDLAEILFPVMVDGLRTKEDMPVDLTCVVVVKFDHEPLVESLDNLMENRTGPDYENVARHLIADIDTTVKDFQEHPIKFLANLMGNSTELSYDDVARLLIADIDAAARDFCNQQKIDDLFKNPRLRIDLEDHIAEQLRRNLDAVGLRFIRLKEVEFHGKIFEHLRAVSGDIEVKRREMEFQLRAAELADDATKRKAVSENEMHDLLRQLAQEKHIQDGLRDQEIARLEEIWKFERAKAEQDAENAFEKGDVLHANELKSLEQDGEIERRQKEHKVLIEQRLAEQNAALTYEQIEVQIQKMKVEAEQEATLGWINIQLRKQRGLQELEIERAKAYQGLDIQALVAAIDDPNRAEHILRLNEANLQARMTPELLLAAAAARGVPEAAAALAAMNSDKQALIEKSKAENAEVYEKMLQMSQEMFNKAADAMAKGNAAQPTTTQIIK